MSRKADPGTGAVPTPSHGVPAPSHAPTSHVQLHAVLARGDQWLAAGTAGDGWDASLVVMRGSAGNAGSTTRVVARNGQYARGLAELGPGRAVVVGEIAVPGAQGPLGHPLFRAAWLEIDDEGNAGRQSIAGVQGATGLAGVVRSGDRLVAGGVNDLKTWIVARRSDGEPLWDTTWPDVDQILDLASDGADRVAVLAAIGPINAQSTPLVRAIDGAGKPLWSWRGRSDVDQALVTIAADPRGGFVVGGSSGKQAAIVALGPDGKERWSRELAAADGTDRIRSVAVAASGEILAAGRRLDSSGRRHLWVRALSAEGEPLGETGSLDREEGEVNASAALQDGWLVVGARQTLPSPLRGSIWRLDRRGNVLWAADATP